MRWPPPSAFSADNDIVRLRDAFENYAGDAAARRKWPPPLTSA
ncbi:hypothetical protein OEM_47530 [Mycobacterium intracellulare subsp. yongonense 05-1390]|nr:hypothetical protein OEM_47530 [Mycobacterium intracellulare subsp. yongonense 05-1390]